MHTVGPAPFVNRGSKPAIVRKVRGPNFSAAEPLNAPVRHNAPVAASKPGAGTPPDETAARPPSPNRRRKPTIVVKREEPKRMSSEGRAHGTLTKSLSQPILFTEQSQGWGEHYDGLGPGLIDKLLSKDDGCRGSVEMDADLSRPPVRKASNPLVVLPLPDAGNESYYEDLNRSTGIADKISKELMKRKGEAPISVSVILELTHCCR